MEFLDLTGIELGVSFRTAFNLFNVWDSLAASVDATLQLRLSEKIAGQRRKRALKTLPYKVVIAVFIWTSNRSKI
jgi:hypothetical protein